MGAERETGAAGRATAALLERGGAGDGERAYIVAGPTGLDTGEKIYWPGESVTLPAAEGDALAESGVLRPKQAAPAGAAPAGTARKAAILAAAKALDPADESLFTADGKARVEALEAALGFDITAAERDEAQAEIEAAGGG